MAANPIVLITGGNAGLGLATVKSLLRSSKKYTILVGGRDLGKAQTAVAEAQQEYPQSSSTVAAVQIDIEDDASISKLSEQVAEQYGRLDVLINNAGAQFDAAYFQGKMSLRDMWNKSWDVNTTGTHIVTHTFVPLLLKASDPRVLFITSGIATLEGSRNPAIPVNRSPPAGWPKEQFTLSAYRASKTGMNMMMREWVRILKEDGVKAWAISPGLLATGLGGNPEILKKMGAEDPALGADFIRTVVEGEVDQHVGEVVRRGGIQPW